ncbi:hypothetical protein MNBD_GAMMA09-1023 [hydrothermal vent metagenome]|uniref:Uracil-DNA glycosylase-like domain-containing protein n=1 Tax=hydrothermal vent metagenome TaxID=652676 RepID=A0A3B0XJ81_9ZZZZ
MLSENLRQQYLAAMGIQTWYDPALDISPVETENALLEVESAQPESSYADNLVTEVRAAQSAVEQQNTSQSDTQYDPVDNKSTASYVNSLSELSVRIEKCGLCELHTVREQVVMGEGHVDAALMIITDAPLGHVLYTAENKTMLQSMLQAIGFDLTTVYLSSLVKCQTPQQRTPFTSEMICCDDHLSAQVKLIRPEVIMVLGELASQQLLVSQKPLADLRLRQHKYLGVPVYASFHPHDLPGNPATKRKVWQDLLQIKNKLG